MFFAAVLHLEHLRLEAAAVALIARHEHVGEKLHLDAHFAFALAGFAAAAGDVEREMARGEAARLGVLRRGENLADRIERLQVRHGIRPRRASDRRLIDEHDVADELGAFELAERADALLRSAFRALHRGIQHVVHERRLARSADTGDAGERVQRNLDVDVLEVVLGRAEQPQLLPAAPPPRRRHRNRQIAAQVLRRQRSLILQQVLERSGKHDAAALLARAEAEVDDGVADANHVFVVLDDEHGVALIAQLPKDVDEPQVVARVQADRRLVEHVQRVDQRRSERRRQVDALRFAARQRRRQAIERQIVQSDVAQKLQPLLNLLQHLVADGRFLLGQLQRLEKLLRLADRVGRHLIDRAAADLDVARLAPQACAAAVGTGQITPIPAEEYANVHLVFLALEPAEESANAVVVLSRLPRR